MPSNPQLFECPMLLVKRHTPLGADIVGAILHFLPDGVHLLSPSDRSPGLLDMLAPIGSAMVEQFKGLHWCVSMCPGYGLERGDRTFDELVPIPDLQSILAPYSAMLAANQSVMYDCIVGLGLMLANGGHSLKIDLSIHQIVPEFARGPDDLAYIVRNEFSAEREMFDPEAPDLDSVRKFYAGAFSGRMDLRWSFETKSFVQAQEQGRPGGEA